MQGILPRPLFRHFEAPPPYPPPHAGEGKSAPKIVKPPVAGGTAAPGGQILASNLTLRELFQQQTAAMLERADLGDEQKQSILIALSCPCCGAGGFSFTAKLRRGR